MSSARTDLGFSQALGWAGWVGLFGLLGCGQVGSASIQTSSLYADLSVTTTGAPCDFLGHGCSQVRAVLRVGGPLSTTFVDLQPGDSLSATMGGMMMQNLTRTPELLGAISYTGTFTGDAANTPFAIAFTHGSDVSAPSSTTTMPVKFTLMAPRVGQMISRAQGFPITWDTASGSTGDRVDISLSGTCVQLLAKLGQNDTGQVTIMPGELEATAGNQQMTCDVQIAVARKHAGTVDTAFGSGGTFYGVQQRKTYVSSAP